MFTYLGDIAGLPAFCGDGDIGVLSKQGLEMRRGLAALAAQQRVPDVDVGFQLLGPESDLTFESDAWTISLDPSTGMCFYCL